MEYNHKIFIFRNPNYGKASVLKKLNYCSYLKLKSRDWPMRKIQNIF